ncbi:hypothetical protein SH668x_001193 [Planctomicrobium sp. SH668]|uniref:hypothetical protein n=1 Tax=Planctomicrobium sp. SH668 TaxID=3448126 RepID=UPI003F5C5F17
MTKSKKAVPHEQWPSFWFSRLEEAVSSNDKAKAAECKERLRTLGWLVRRLREKA